MKSISIFFLSSIFILCILSFTPTDNSSFHGTFGASELDTSGIVLKINEDKSFNYSDLSNTPQAINVTGKWEIRNRTVYLSQFESDAKFHTAWKISKDGTKVFSRAGGTFYVLTKHIDKS